VAGGWLGSCGLRGVDTLSNPVDLDPIRCRVRARIVVQQVLGRAREPRILLPDDVHALGSKRAHAPRRGRSEPADSKSGSGTYRPVPSAIWTPRKRDRRRRRRGPQSSGRRRGAHRPRAPSLTLTGRWWMWNPDHGGIFGNDEEVRLGPRRSADASPRSQGAARPRAARRDRTAGGNRARRSPIRGRRRWRAPSLAGWPGRCGCAPRRAIPARRSSLGRRCRSTTTGTPSPAPEPGAVSSLRWGVMNPRS
jgi:hypothetical protein